MLNMNVEQKCRTKENDIIHSKTVHKNVGANIPLNVFVQLLCSMTNFQIETNETIQYDLIINGSSAGLTGKFKPPSDLLLLDKKTFFYDLNYSLAETPFCKWASRYSDNVYDGLGMLVHQAAHSFERWFNIFPDTDPVIQDLIKMRT